MGDNTHFGFQQVPEGEKAQRVAGVFSSVAQKYDVMNDLMSGGLHRLWKSFAIELSGTRKGQRILDVAGGPEICRERSPAALVLPVRFG
jgi:demethylmenaquinone methyltransferase/2-methoxy-6-polyprenyl-1,4-benzoquinol methylase